MRVFFLMGFFVNAGLLFFTCYLEWVQHLTPCALCLMQRACILAMALMCLFGFLFKKRRITGVLLYGFMIAGLYFSLRQLWLQSLPAGAEAACLPSLDILMRYFPWRDVVYAFIWGSADCRDITWYLWGHSLAAWSFVYFLMCFMLFSGLLVYEYIRKKSLF